MSNVRQNTWDMSRNTVFMATAQPQTVNCHIIIKRIDLIRFLDTQTHLAKVTRRQNNQYINVQILEFCTPRPHAQLKTQSTTE